MPAVHGSVSQAWPEASPHSATRRSAASKEALSPRCRLSDAAHGLQYALPLPLGLVEEVEVEEVEGQEEEEEVEEEVHGQGVEEAEGEFTSTTDEERME